MATTVILGHVNIQLQWGVGGAGPAEAWAWAWGFAFDANGDVIRDTDGNAAVIAGNAALASTDSTPGTLRARIETSAAEWAEAQYGITDTLTFVWADQDL